MERKSNIYMGAQIVKQKHFIKFLRCFCFKDLIFISFFIINMNVSRETLKKKKHYYLIIISE